MAFSFINISPYYYPPIRMLHSISPIKNLFYLFGGYNDGVFYQDLWTFDEDLLLWQSLPLSGYPPSPRHSHAACAQGDILLIFGGEYSNSLLNDLFIYNAVTSMWLEIIPNTNDKPSPRKGACLLLHFPMAYIFGGNSYNGDSNELWSFNFNVNLYKLVSNADFSASFIFCYYFSDSLFYGLLFNSYYYYFNNNSWVNKPINKFVQDASKFLEVNYHQFAGYDFYLYLTEELNLQSSNNNSDAINSYAVNVFNGALFYFKSNVYLHDGSAYTKYISTANQDKAMPFFVSVNMKVISPYYDANFDCSPGTTIFNETYCKLCPPGTFTEKIGASTCQECRKGTFNAEYGANFIKQCYPCPEFHYSDAEGAKICKDCPAGSYCPIGATNFLYGQQKLANSSIQPLSYASYHNTNTIESIQFYSALVLFLAVFLAIVLLKMFRVLKKVDAFTRKHNYTIGKTMKLRQTGIGACFSLIFVGVTLFLLINLLSNYLLNNIIELKTLQPLPVLESEVPSFTSDLEVSVILLYYGDACGQENECGSQILVSIIDLKYEFHSYQCTLIENSCIISFKFKTFELDLQGYIEIQLVETYSFSSSIAVNVSSSSSVPESISSVLIGIPAVANQMLIGAVPSQFNFALTPSLFISDSTLFPLSSTGYHVASQSAPVSGSRATVNEFANQNSLALTINFIKNQYGLLTNRYVNQTIYLAISSLLGTIGGIISLVAFFMNVFEGWYKNYWKKIRNKKNLKEIAHNCISLKNECETPPIRRKKRNSVKINDTKIENPNRNTFILKI